MVMVGKGQWQMKRLRTLLAVLLAAASGWIGGTLAQGVPSSSLRKAKVVQSGAVSADFGGAGSAGGITGDSGQTWVEGSGLLQNDTDEYCNDWCTAHANTRYRGEISNAEGKWKLNAIGEVKLKPKASYVATNPAYLEDYRVECHAVLEIRGDFWAVVANKQTVDDYTTSGTYYYDAVGGGVPPTTYPNIGVESVATGPGPFSGIVENNGSCAQNFTAERIQNTVVFHLYVAGTQYMHNNHEEDVSLYSALDHPTDADGAPVKGWHGTATSYKFESGSWVEIQVHPL
jgi:hypothetical protein